ncbi:MAG: hypothetical protein VKO21_10175, partial [Candidatus Sericytochromatia bacterium]|nr:hypothetical protein [Candidatus Sericytochromatia bacterium]
TFHSSATLDSNDTLTFTGVTGSNGTDPVTGVPFVEIGLTHAPVQYRLDSVAAGLTDGTARSSTPASVIVSVGGHTVAWDPSGTNGWSFTDNRTIRLDGAARPTATQGIKVDYRTDYTVNSGGSMTPRDDDGDGAVDLVFSETPEIYGLDDALAAQALAGLRGGTALRAVSSAGGGLDDLVYDPVTRTLTFQGTSQGTLAQDLGQRYFADQGLVQDTDGTLEIQLARASDTWGLAAPDQDGLIRGAGTNDLDALKVITNGTVQLSGWQLESADPRRLNLDSPGILPDAMQSLDHSIRA